ncbi:hypothetical protein AGLY_014472, partial [Aphis glycines]
RFESIRYQLDALGYRQYMPIDSIDLLIWTIFYIHQIPTCWNSRINYTLELSNCYSLRKLAPALATGCTVVLKPAEQTPFTALIRKYGFRSPLRRLLLDAATNTTQWNLSIALMEMRSLYVIQNLVEMQSFIVDNSNYRITSKNVLPATFQYKNNLCGILCKIFKNLNSIIHVYQHQYFYQNIVASRNLMKIFMNFDKSAPFWILICRRFRTFVNLLIFLYWLTFCPSLETDWVSTLSSVTTDPFLKLNSNGKSELSSVDLTGAVDLTQAIATSKYLHQHQLLL